MAILKIARMGHPILRQVTPDLSRDAILEASTQALVESMITTMHEYEGVGLAAPQIHENQRLIVIECAAPGEKKKQPLIPLTVLFNARIISHGSEQLSDWEGCLSIPEIRGLVPRYTNIEVQALNRQAKPVQFKASGFFARVLQHEIDHLDGILFPQRMTDLSQLYFIDEFYRFPPPGQAD